jgi:hypothetical protein
LAAGANPFPKRNIEAQMHNNHFSAENKQFTRAKRRELPDEFETFGDDERLAREHAEYFYEEYLHDVGALP